MRRSPTRALRILRSAAVVAMIVALPLAPGCQDPKAPKTWAKKIKKPAFRELAIKTMTDLYTERLIAAKGNREDPAVKEAADVMIPALVETFNKYKTDNASRSAISTLLSQMRDPRAIPVFEDLLSYQKGISETDASKGAEALGVLGSDESIPKIIGLLGAIKADRGSEGRNRPEDDWMARASVEALRAIVVQKPDTPHRAAAIDALNEALETTADQQDFFINKVAAKALGDIADPTSIPILIRGLFFQGRGATVFQQCRVALLRIAVENRKEVVDGLFQAYKGENKELEKDAERFSFFHGIKENKIGIMFFDLRITPEENKEVFDYLIARVQDEEVDKEGVLQGMASETLAMLGYEPLVGAVLELTDSKDWQNDAFKYKIFASFMSGLIGTNSLKMPMIFDERLLPLMFYTLEEMTGDANAPFRVSAGLVLSVIAPAEDAERFEKLVAAEENPDVKEQLEGFGTRFKVKAECKEEQGCWMEKLKIDDEDWRAKQLAVLWLGQHAQPGDAVVVDALSGMLNQGKDANDKPLGTRNQDVLKAVILALDRLSPKGCVGKECERLSKITPYFAKKPQYAVLANSSECLHANLVGRQGGKLSQLAPLKAIGTGGEE